MKAPVKKLRMPKVVYENEPLSVKAWLITLGLFVVIFALIVIVFPVERVLSSAEYHFEGHRPRDQIAQSYMLIDNQDVEPFDTVIFGTSSVRAAYDNASDLNESYKERYGVDIAFVNLSSTAQTFMQTLIFANKVKFRANQTVIFSVTPSSFARSPDFTIESFVGGFHPVDFLYSLKDQLETVPELTKYIDEQATRKNQLKSFRSQIHSNINLGLRQWAQENIYGTYPSLFRFHYDALSHGDDRVINAAQTEKARVLERGFERYHDYNMRLFRIILEKVLDAGATIHFVEQPRFEGDETFLPYQKKYDALIAKLNADYPITYSDFNDQVLLTRDDYYDVTHVSTTGRAKWSDAFLNWMGKINAKGESQDVR